MLSGLNFIVYGWHDKLGKKNEKKYGVEDNVRILERCSDVRITGTYLKMPVDPFRRVAFLNHLPLEKVQLVYPIIVQKDQDQSINQTHFHSNNPGPQ